MAGVPSIESVLWFLTVVGYTILLARLLSTHLHLVYRYFFLYIAFKLMRSVVLLSLERGTNAYGGVYVATEPVVWVFYVLVILELFTVVLKDYPGIQSWSRRLLVVGLAVSALVALATLLPDWGGPAERYPILRIVYVAQRVVMSTLVLFFTILTVFLGWYPVPLNRNVVVYCAGYCLYFLCATMGLFVRNLSGESYTRLVSTVLQGLAAGCLFAWTLLLTPEGERKRVVVRRHIRMPDEDRLMGQLESINRNLLRSAKK